ncbi:MAG: hypothetical protein VX583_07855 [Bdellovibrionota bacterium]|nr:hypothetical protein [Pseudobdellovibrionaceae bacterium]|tara:strand:- start:14106 stop:14996 length:891 start_codon:yes stop_codon:yes gene_type:complete
MSIKKSATVLMISSIFLASCGGSSKKADDKSSSQNIGKEDFEPEAYGKSETEEIKVSQEMNPNKLADELKEVLKAQKTREIPVIAGKILSRDENNIAALNALGVYNFQRNKFGIASIFWNRVLKLQEKNSQALNNLGVIAAKDSKDSDAITFFKKAIKADSSNVSAYANLGSLYIKYYNFKAAEATLDLARSDLSDKVDFLNNYGLALYGSGNASKSIDVLQDAISKSPKNIPLATNYVAVLVDSGQDLMKAEKLVTQLKLLTQDPKQLVRLSKISRELNSKLAAKRAAKSQGGKK